MIADNPNFGRAHSKLASTYWGAHNLVWHRLTLWADAVNGLARLKEKFVISALSNSNISLLVEMAKFARLPWDMVISAELFHH